MRARPSRWTAMARIAGPLALQHLLRGRRRSGEDGDLLGGDSRGAESRPLKRGEGRLPPSRHHVSLPLYRDRRAPYGLDLRREAGRLQASLYFAVAVVVLDDYLAENGEVAGVRVQHRLVFTPLFAQLGSRQSRRTA